MGIRDPKEAMVVLPIHNDVLRTIDLLSITNDNDSNLMHSGFRKVVAPSIRILIKVKRDGELLIRGHVNGPLKSLLIKANGRVRLMKNALKQVQSLSIEGMAGVEPIVTI